MMHYNDFLKMKDVVKKSTIFDVAKCDHGMDKLRMVRGRVGMPVKMIVCRCGKRYKYG
jgi:hypothetical protein